MLDLRQLRESIQALNTGDEPSRREALRALKRFESQEWAEAAPNLLRPLVEWLRLHLQKNRDGTMVKPSPIFRQEIVTLLGNIGPQASSCVEPLVELLGEETVAHALREATVSALGKMGKEAKVAVDALIKVLTPECRVTLAARVARALSEIGCADQRVRSALTRLWLVPVQCPDSRSQIALALCKLKLDARGLLPTLSNTVVSSSNAALRRISAEALSHCNKNDIDVVPALTVALHDDDEEVKRLAELGLAQMHLPLPKAIQLCAKQLKDSTHAELALKKNGDASVAALITAVASEEPIVRERAAKALGAIGEVAVRAAPALKKNLRDRHLETRLATAKALWNISKEADAVVPVLADLLAHKFTAEQDANDERRRFVQTVIEALTRIGPPAEAALPALQKMAKDENRLIRESAGRAIKEIDARSAAGAAAR